MAKHERNLKRAAAVAQLSDYPKHQLGCVIADNHQVFVCGWNSKKTHPLQREYNKLRFDGDDTPHSLHAEMAALINARHMDIDYSNCTLYVSRHLKNGQPGCARPCPSCMAAIKSFGINKIVYTTDDGYAVEKLKGTN